MRQVLLPKTAAGDQRREREKPGQAEAKRATRQRENVQLDSKEQRRRELKERLAGEVRDILAQEAHEAEQKRREAEEEAARKQRAEVAAADERREADQRREEEASAQAEAAKARGGPGSSARTGKPREEGTHRGQEKGRSCLGRASHKRKCALDNDSRGK